MAMRTRADSVNWVVSWWGVVQLKHSGRWAVVFGDPYFYVVNGVYRNCRRAKKEITHYVLKGNLR